jgi:hypothetical protein
LELDQIGSRIGRGINQLLRHVNVTVMIDARFSDD